MRRILSVLSLFVVLVSASPEAQWLNYKTPGVPRTADGKPRLDAPAPRTADGHPDLSGVWMHEATTVAEVKLLFGPVVDEFIKVDVPGMEIGTQHKYGLNILLDFKPEDSPMRPETAGAFQRRLSAPPPEDLCDAGGLPGGIPLAGLLSEPIKIVQARHLTMVLYELGGDFRQIYTDGRKLPDQLRVVERFRRRDFGHLDVEMTFDDPKLYTRPFTVRIPHNLMADDDIFEMFPQNEKDCARIGAKK